MSGQSQRTTTAEKSTEEKKVQHVGNDWTIGTNKNDRDQKFADTEGGGIRDDEIKSESGGLGGFLGDVADSIAGALNPQNTQMEDLPPELMDSLVDGTVLRFAFNPTDMEALALGDERRALEAVGDILTVNNPSKEVMEYLLGSEKFTDLVWSGHGSEDGLFTTGADGKADLMDNEVISSMLEESSIEEVFFAVCDGGRKLDDMVNDAGIDTYAYGRKVGDDEAMTDLQEFVTGGDLSEVEGRTIEIPDFSMMGFDPFGYGMGMGMGYPGGYGTQTINIGGDHQMGDSQARQERRERNRNKGKEFLQSLFGLGKPEKPGEAAAGAEPKAAAGPAPVKEPAAPAATTTAPAATTAATTTAPKAPAAQQPVPPPEAYGPYYDPYMMGMSSFDYAATGYNLGGINYY